MPKINGNSLNNHNYKLNTSASTPKTSSNASFNQKFSNSLRHSTGSVSEFLKKGSQGIPGAAVLSSALSGIASAAGSGTSAGIGANADGSLNSMDNFQNQMQDRQERILKAQAEIGEITTEYSALSNMLRTKTETEKQMAGNIK